MSASTLLKTNSSKSNSSAEASIKGLLTGSMVLTMNGYRAIETLKVGERLVTRGGVRVLTRVQSQQAQMRPIRISEGTLGCSRPKQDMMVAPAQEVIVRDWRAEVLFGSETTVVAVSRMVDGKHIAPVAEKGIHTAYSLHFASDEVYYADGMEFFASADTSADQSTAQGIAA